MLYDDCCEADDCKDECMCYTHGCTTCGRDHGCRCDADYDYMAGK